MGSDLSQRAAVHAALGDPVRLGIVDELVCSDRSPSELSGRFGLAGNLLAHHLGVLEEAGLIERVQSRWDRRRRYIHLRRERLGAVDTIAEHPTGPVLFVCTQNSARSQLAAALWVQATGSPAKSAGTEPAERVHPEAVRAARRAGLDLSACVPTLVSRDELGGAFVVTVCDRAHEEIDPAPDWWHWSIADPVAVGTHRAFEQALSEIDDRVSAVCGRTELAPDG